jgi:TRAP-type mannitol/chloroaromatic compound transport system substrate-binding protein
MRPTRIYIEISAKNASFKKVYDSMRDYRKEEVLWFRVAENTFDNFLARQSAANKR